MNSYISIYKRKGFTLLEILISVGIIALSAAGAILLYSGFLEKTGLSGEGNGIASTLRNAEVRATTGDSNQNWGVHFVNNAINPDYYQLFYGSSFASGTVVSINYLADAREFGDPISGASKDIIFAQTTGSPAATSSVSIQLVRNAANAVQIYVNAYGLVTITNF